MDNLNRVLKESFGVEMATEFDKTAKYNDLMDYVEYLSEDTVSVSQRIDGFLTLIFDAYDKDKVVGLRIKGFRHFYVEKIRPVYGDSDFLPLVKILEEVVSYIGSSAISNSAYEAAKKIANDDDVRIAHLEDIAA